MSPKQILHYYLDWLPMLATAGIGIVQTLIALSPLLIHMLIEILGIAVSGVAAR